jgi:hypothetical protein
MYVQSGLLRALRERLRLPAADGIWFRDGGIFGLWGGEVVLMPGL